MMTASRDSVAYQQYEERFPVEQKRELRVAPSPRRPKKKKIPPHPFLRISLFFTTAAPISFFQMQLTELTTEVSRQNDALSELTAENVSLTTRQMSSVNLDEVEKYAVNTLGMVKMDNSQIEYVSLTNPDTVTVSDSGISLDALFSGLARSFSAIVEYIN